MNKAKNKTNFKQALLKTLNQLQTLEQKWQKNGNSKRDKEIEFFNLRANLEQGLINTLPPDEQFLFTRFFDLFALKHVLNPLQDMLRQLLQKHSGKLVGFLGPLGSGKSTIAAALIEDLTAKFVVKEPYRENPFWEKSQTNPAFMLRSQIYFLLSNIYSDMLALTQAGISVSDTSTLTDILMWVNWYAQTGHIKKSEHRLYLMMVELLKPIIPKPSLLVALLPTSLDQLYKGIRERQKNETWRAGELVFTKKDLNKQLQTVKKLTKIIPKKWGVSLLTIKIDPILAYKDPFLKYDYIYQIRKELSMLNSWLNPPPDKVVKQITRIMAESLNRCVIVIHGKSMFTGKTTVLCKLLEEVGADKALAFQPKAAIRYGKEQQSAIISRDGLKIAAITVENSLFSIIDYLSENNISPNKTPYIYIDEVTLFVNNAQNPKKAIQILEMLRRMGFHVVVSGIAYTFQEEPFTFMFDLLREAVKNPHWHQFEMSTRCRYCNKKAQGTRRVKLGKNGNREIASYTDTTFVAGDSIYEPVCCVIHPSCVNQPKNFIKQKLPTA